MKKEQTSPEIARIAGELLSRLGEAPDREWILVTVDRKVPEPIVPLCKVSELKALAGSALTQAPDQSPAETKKRRRRA